MDSSVIEILVPAAPSTAAEVALLALRLFMGVCFIRHGWPKLRHLGTWAKAMNTPVWLCFLSAFSMWAAGLALLPGLLTPLAAFAILASMAYAVQQAHYQQAFPDRDFLFICVDKDPDLPQVAVYKLDAAAVALGQRQWRHAFRRLIECRRTDHWPSYQGSESGVIELSLPPWADAIGEPPEHSIAPGLVPPGFSE